MLSLEEAVSSLKSGPLLPEAEHFVTFLEKSKRGIMRPRLAQQGDREEERVEL